MKKIYILECIETFGLDTFRGVVGVSTNITNLRKIVGSSLPQTNKQNWTVLDTIQTLIVNTNLQYRITSHYSL